MPHPADLHNPLTAPAVSADDRRERRDAAAHRRRILAEALRLFVERGVDAVTMDEIARAAGVGKGTLYRRYRDKGELCLELIQGCLRAFREEAVAEVRVSSGSPLEGLARFLGRWASWVEEHGPWLGAIADQAAGPRRCESYAGPVYAWLHEVVLEQLEHAVAVGEAELASPAYTADALLAALDVDLLDYQRSARGYSLADIQAGICELVMGLSVHQAERVPPGRR